MRQGLLRRLRLLAMIFRTFKDHMECGADHTNHILKSHGAAGGSHGSHFGGGFEKVIAGGMGFDKGGVSKVKRAGAGGYTRIKEHPPVRRSSRPKQA